jgi:hypothetical protein
MALRVTDVLNAPLITEPGAIHNVGLASFACLNLSAQEWGEKMRSCYETQNVCSFLQPFDPDDGVRRTNSTPHPPCYSKRSTGRT